MCHFIEYEYKNNLFDLKIKNVKVWIYLREIIYCDILKTKGYINDSFTQVNNKRKYDSIASIFIRNKGYKYIFNNPIKSLEESDLLILTHPRRIKNKDTYDCTVFDILLENVQYKYTVFGEPLWVDSIADFESHYRPVKTQNLIYTDRIEFLFEVNYRIRKFFNKIFKTRPLDNKEIESVKIILDDINKIFNVNLNTMKYTDLFGKILFL